MRVFRVYPKYPQLHRSVSYWKMEGFELPNYARTSLMALELFVIERKMANKVRMVYFLSQTFFLLSLGHMYDCRPTGLYLVLLLLLVTQSSHAIDLFHNIFLRIPWHTRTHNCSSRIVQRTFHCSDKANWCTETEKKELLSLCQTVILGRSAALF